MNTINSNNNNNNNNNNLNENMNMNMNMNTNRKRRESSPVSPAGFENTLLRNTNTQIVFLYLIFYFLANIS